MTFHERPISHTKKDPLLVPLKNILNKKHLNNFESAIINTNIEVRMDKEESEEIFPER